MAALVLVVGCGSSTGSPSLPATAGTGSTVLVASPSAQTGQATPGPSATAPPTGAHASGGPAATSSPPVPSGGLTITVDRRRLPVATSRAVAFTDGRDLILAGGLTGLGTSGAVFRIPGTGGAMGSDGRLAHPVHDAAGITLAGMRLVLGGGVTTQEAWVQRLSAGSSGSVVGRLPAARADLGAVVVGAEAIVVGGGAAGAADPRILATRDGVHFRLVARLRIAVRYAAVAAAGGLVYVIGGNARSGDVAAIQVVDVAAGTVRVAGRLPATISHATALVVGNAIVVAGGRHAGRAIDLVQSVDPATFAVTDAGRLPRPMSDAAGVELDGIGYLIGGEDLRPLATIIAIGQAGT